mgnify:CR=1 FL=1
MLLSQAASSSQGAERTPLAGDTPSSRLATHRGEKGRLGPEARALRVLPGGDTGAQMGSCGCFPSLALSHRAEAMSGGKSRRCAKGAPPAVARNGSSQATLAALPGIRRSIVSEV